MMIQKMVNRGGKRNVLSMIIVLRSNDYLTKKHKHTLKDKR